MRVIPNFSPDMLSNSYLIGPDTPGEAILIDPGQMDIPLLKKIEGNGYYIKGVFITHASQGHTKGLKTLLRIYDAAIYARHHSVVEVPCKSLKQGDKVQIGDITVHVQAMSEHNSDTLIYQIGDWLFTGDVLSAGDIGKSTNAFLHSNMENAVKDRILKKEEELYIFPGYGPPTTLAGEKQFNSVMEKKDDFPFDL